MAPQLRLRQGEFEQLCRKEGLHSKDAKARFIKVSPSSMGRVLSGKRVPGNAFIAATLAAFKDRGVRFYDLYQLCSSDAGAEE